MSRRLEVNPKEVNAVDAARNAEGYSEASHLRFAPAFRGRDLEWNLRIQKRHAETAMALGRIAAHEPLRRGGFPNQQFDGVVRLHRLGTC